MRRVGIVLLLKFCGFILMCILIYFILIFGVGVMKKLILSGIKIL